MFLAIRFRPFWRKFFLKKYVFLILDSCKVNTVETYFEFGIVFSWQFSKNSQKITKRNYFTWPQKYHTTIFNISHKNSWLFEPRFEFSCKLKKQILWLDCMITWRFIMRETIIYIIFLLEKLVFLSFWDWAKRGKNEAESNKLIV